jgi:hypothetical protein
MTQWFGKSWGAPCCEEDEHVPVPVNELCARCRELILEGDQGVVMPFVELGREGTLAFHLDCYLKGLLPHGPECPRCRGAERIDHDRECAYRVSGGNCSCRLTREVVG